LDDSLRKHLNYTLSGPAITQALSENTSATITPFQSTLDDLFTRSRRFRHTREFAEAVDFVARFHEYSAFNNMLVYLQNPNATFFATATHWAHKFGRAIKEDARPMLILAPRTPVLLVYDVSDTEGGPLPGKYENFSKTTGRFQPRVLDHTLRNCARDFIRIDRKPMSPLHAGQATLRIRDPLFKVRITLREDLDDAAAYAILCHELAHVFLGHVGACRNADWPYRAALSNPIAEIEAEATAHIVCRRAGLETRSAQYLANYFNGETDLESVSLDLISRVAGRIEEMGRKILPPRKSPDSV
jgi:hypothetical protein